MSIYVVSSRKHNIFGHIHNYSTEQAVSGRLLRKLDGRVSTARVCRAATLVAKNDMGCYGSPGLASQQDGPLPCSIRAKNFKEELDTQQLYGRSVRQYVRAEKVSEKKVLVAYEKAKARPNCIVVCDDLSLGMKLMEFIKVLTNRSYARHGSRKANGEAQSVRCVDFRFPLKMACVSVLFLVGLIVAFRSVNSVSEHSGKRPCRGKCRSRKRRCSVGRHEGRSSGPITTCVNSRSTERALWDLLPPAGARRAVPSP